MSFEIDKRKQGNSPLETRQALVAQCAGYKVSLKMFLTVSSREVDRVVYDRRCNPFLKQVQDKLSSV